MKSKKPQVSNAVTLQTGTTPAIDRAQHIKAAHGVIKSHLPKNYCIHSFPGSVPIRIVQWIRGRDRLIARVTLRSDGKTFNVAIENDLDETDQKLIQNITQALSAMPSQVVA